MGKTDEDDRPKVLISQKDLKDTTSGIPKKVHEEIRLFKNLGYLPFAIAERIDKEAVSRSGGIPIKTLRWPINGYFRRMLYARQVEHWAKKNRPDLIVGHGDILHQDILFIHNCAHLAYELMNAKPLPPGNGVGKLHKAILTDGDFRLLICNSGLMEQDLTRRFDVPKEKTVVIHPEFDPEKFNIDDAPSRRPKKRTELGFGDRIVIGLITSGNFQKRNVDLLIDSAQKLVADFPDTLHFFVAGKNSDDRYSQRVKALGIDRHFTFAPSISEVEDYYHAIDIFVLPAHIEEFGRSVLEAMGCARPVVVSNTVGSAEILEGESRDFILKELAADFLIAAARPLIESAESREKIGAS